MEPVKVSLASEKYYLAEWAMFLSKPERKRASLAATAGRRVSDVLDVGCGAGQELLPFVELGARGTGIDISPAAVQTASQQFARLGLAYQTEFRCGRAESLPFESNTFDVVICREVLAYTHNESTLAEIARVLCPGGLLILRIHHLRAYIDKFFYVLSKGHPLRALQLARVVTAGTVYHLTGHQPDNWLVKHEVYQTLWMLRRMLAPRHLRLIKELEISGPNRHSPTLLIEKSLSQASSRARG
jgi:ubiquinone/menaquinone biosynthesis C-methylase UbiE